MTVESTLLKCPDCDLTSSVRTDFVWVYRTGRPPRLKRCKECRRKRDRMYYATRARDIQVRAYARKTPEQRKAATRRTKEWLKRHPGAEFSYGLKRRYRISLVKYLCTLLQQDYKCAARCGRGQNCWGGSRILKPAVDHNHDTGCFRGLLCLWCNQMLGHLGDTARSVRCESHRYLAYLEGGL